MKLAEYITEGSNDKDLVKAIGDAIYEMSEYLNDTINKMAKDTKLKTREADAERRLKDTLGATKVGFSNTSRPSTNNIDIKKVNWSKKVYAVVVAGDEVWSSEVSLTNASVDEDVELASEALQQCMMDWEEWAMGIQEDIINDYKY